MTYKKKLIEVVLPLEAINIASAGCDLRADGRRSVGASGPVPHREKAGEGAAAVDPHHRGPGEVGEHHQRAHAAAGARGIAVQRSLSLGQVDREYHLRQPFQREPDFAVTRVNSDFADLLTPAVNPRHQLSKAARM